jgi:hypothetical protein
LDILQVMIKWSHEIFLKIFCCCYSIGIAYWSCLFIFIYRINGHLLMMSEQFYYPSKVFLEVDTKIENFKQLPDFYALLLNCFLLCTFLKSFFEFWLM